MAIQLKHKGCSTVVAEYIGAVPLEENPVMRGKDWVVMGVQQELCSIKPILNCPDCFKSIGVKAEHLEPA